MNSFSESRDSFIRTGKALAGGKWSKWMNRISDPWGKISTAVLLENQQRWFTQKKMEMWDINEEEVQHLEETTSMSAPGISTFEKYAFCGRAATA